MELPDGDFVDLDITSTLSNAPTVLLLHGLEGSSASPYIRGMAATLKARGFRVIVMHFRGCSGAQNRLPRTYHSGDTADLGFVVQMLNDQYPSTPLALVGYSLGGNVVMKFLGEQADRAPIAAAVAISVPMVLAQCAQRLEHGLSRIYQWWLLRSLHRKLRSKPDDWHSSVKFSQVGKWRTFTAFDHNVTAPLHDFSSGADYYAKSSGRQFLPSIRVPTLLLHSRDDPFMTHAVLPARTELSRSVQFELSETGGHVGFVYGTVPWRARYWLEERVPEFLDEFLPVK